MMTYAADQPLVSVCIQTYQHADYIKECLDSVIIQQTDFPFEIILGEDDSTDGTREICIDYANKNPSIRLFLRSEKNKIYINGNKTGRFNFIENLRAARGKYIALIDGDDYWCDDLKLQKQIDFMEMNPDCSMSFHHTLRCWKKGLPFPHDIGLPDKNTKYVLEDLLKYNKINTVSCVFVRQNIDDIPGWFYDVPFLDYPLHVHNAQKGKIGFIAQAMGVYRIHRTSMWSSQAAPANLIKLWHLHSIMAINFNGKIGSVMLSKRYQSGIDLISFYKNRLWHNSDWLKTELEKQEFEQDRQLLNLLISSFTLKNYFMTGWNYCKHIGRKIKR